jgi:hypothetical protein
MYESQLLKKIVETTLKPSNFIDQDELDINLYKKMLEAKTPAMTVNTMSENALNNAGLPKNLVSTMLPFKDMFTGLSFVFEKLMDEKLWIYSSLGILLGIFFSLFLYCFFNCQNCCKKSKKQKSNEKKVNKKFICCI